MDSENFIEDLKPYGILAREGCEFNLPEEAKIKISDATIESIDFDVLQEKGIKELTIGFSKISNIKFSNQNDLRICFFKCNFLEQVFALECNFEKEVEFIGCNFQKEVYFSGAKFQDKASFKEAKFQDKASFFKTKFLANQDKKTIENNFRRTNFEKEVYFSEAEFQARVNFSISRFKGEARFLKTKFLANQEDNKTIENNFRETSFENKVYFSEAEFQARVNFSISRFKGEARFLKTKFLANQEDNKIIENNFGETSFENKVSFSEAIFKAKVDFSISRFKGEARFIKAQFLANQKDNKIIENNFRETIFENKVSFGGAIFQARVNFYLSKFKDEVRFIDTVFESKNFIFEDVEFYHAEFISIEKSAEQKYHFKNVIFKDVTSFKNLNIGELNFENVIFNNIVVFKDVDFVLNDKSKINKPNFINCTFSNQFNIEHKYIQYDFDEIKAKINSDTEKNYKNLLNYRDLFRKLKSNRIAHHNQIDASELRTQELYARELELKYKKDKSLKEKIERWQLIFYHQLCDHHTDFLRVFNNLILLISLYVLYSFFILYISGKEIINDTKIYLSDIFHNNIFWYIPGILLFICVCSIYFCKNKEKTHVINREIKIKKFQWCQIIIKEILKFLFVCMICYAGISIFGIVGDFLAKFFGLKIFKDVVYISFACLSFFGLFLFFINSLVLRYIFISFSYFVVAFVLFLKPKEFYFIYNIFKDDDKNLAIMSSLNVVYFTLIILILFSLQKTARKNSIVPS
ncbi:pentapeptide repeat-containing protein [Campylobacter sp. RM3125]|uniref:pentapeptide repeat-containing protein n=1 Tax=Campylobacter molothri TaxID=1032242 RepID=UPI00301E2E37|nr:pentapeptide repeat-containing protein [Campylobacter sp. RM3125]MBZ7971192.1 pentapeptide repeat-containing protein [Campylobacter sp. RM3124]